VGRGPLIVLDTHVLVWLDGATGDLGSEAAGRIEQEFAEDRVAVSAISFWEVAMLVAKGRLEMARPLALWREELLSAGVQELAIDGRVGIQAAELSDFHGDPADRLIVAGALQGGWPLVTADQRILGWRGKLPLIDARR
jgi:PIN domain nuclease of toxin-antitoxin system